MVAMVAMVAVVAVVAGAACGFMSSSLRDGRGRCPTTLCDGGHHVA